MEAAPFAQTRPKRGQTNPGRVLSLGGSTLKIETMKNRKCKSEWKQLRSRRLGQKEAKQIRGGSFPWVNEP